MFADPFKVAGMPAIDGPTGLRPDAAEPSRDVTRHRRRRDRRARRDSRSATSRSSGQGAYGETFDGEFSPVDEARSRGTPTDSTAQFCGEDTYGLVNAAFCSHDNTIGWDRGELLPALRKANGDMAVTMVLAHEYGHAVQQQAGLIKHGTPTLVVRAAGRLPGRRRTCAGSPRATRRASRFSTGDGLNNLLAGDDRVPRPAAHRGRSPEAGGDEHGSAFERVSAFQFGFTDGAVVVRGDRPEEIEQRRGDLPVLLPADRDRRTGRSPRTRCASIVDAMGILFSPANPPQLSFDAVGGDCPDARPSPPASYCPATNTIVVDLPALEKMGTQSDDEDGGGWPPATTPPTRCWCRGTCRRIQHEHGGVALDNAEAALRTACLTGVATAKMTTESPPPTATPSR